MFEEQLHLILQEDTGLVLDKFKQNNPDQQEKLSMS